MSSIQLPLPAGPHHRNQQLFSDYYLDTLLPQRGDWQMLAAAAEAAKAHIKAIFAGFTPSKNEAQTEHELVRPILASLGHTFEVQASLATPQGTKTPDYILYRDISALNANKGVVLDEARLAAGGLAVGEAKYWERPLDVTLQEKGDPFDNRNPSYQIAFYMLHSGVTWGILTNGRLWRLYHRDTSHKLDRYYEVDLPALLASEDPGAFLYFYAFFRRAAFDSGPLALAALLQASRDYAAGVSETLKAQVYEALRHLAQGFLDTPDNRLVPDAGTLKAIYGHSLIVLYRLLFVFYAEARGLLPVAESELYRSRYSLYAIARDVARDLRSGVHLLPTSTTLWPRLRELFHIIDAGSPPLQVATFNGGLFDPRKHAFLEEHTVGDAHLQAAIDRLARVDGQFIDYRDLAERHLGTIYEGLLEYHLQMADGESQIANGKSQMADGERWTVDLVNDKGERHATGSYYTPDYIVKYIVEQAVGPALAAAVAGKRDDRARIEAVLGVNVLDPAMGSGHFLVEATEYIARFLVDLGVRPSAGGENRRPAALRPPIPVYRLRLGLLEAPRGAVVHLWGGSEPAGGGLGEAVAVADHRGAGSAAVVPGSSPPRGQLAGGRTAGRLEPGRPGSRRTGDQSAPTGRAQDAAGRSRGPDHLVCGGRLPAEHEPGGRLAVADRRQPGPGSGAGEGTGAPLRRVAPDIHRALRPPGRPVGGESVWPGRGPGAVGAAGRVRREAGPGRLPQVRRVAGRGRRARRAAPLLPLGAGVPRGLLRPPRPAAGRARGLRRGDRQPAVCAVRSFSNPPNCFSSRRLPHSAAPPTCISISTSKACGCFRSPATWPTSLRARFPAENSPCRSENGSLPRHNWRRSLISERTNLFLAQRWCGLLS